MKNIVYIEKDEKGLDLIKPLWEKLREHHQTRSPYFANEYDKFSFKDRKKNLLKKSKNGRLRVDLAKENEMEDYLGYCVCSISADGEGEIDSMYIKEKYRNQGIGDNFMKRALEWMELSGAKNKRVVVVVGNEDAVSFYSHYGFFPRQIILEQKEK